MGEWTGLTRFHLAIINLKRTMDGPLVMTEFYEDACRRCALSQGLSPDWRCKPDSDPLIEQCKALADLIEERCGGEVIE